MGSSGLSTDSNTGDHVTLSAFQMGATPATAQVSWATTTAFVFPQDQARILFSGAAQLLGRHRQKADWCYLFVLGGATSPDHHRSEMWSL